jgi:succinoglycan biosynthesis transport protein ExoP
MENLIAAPPAASEQTSVAERINLRHYWHVALERRWLIVTIFFSVLLLTLVYLYRAPRIFQATVRLEINRESENVLNIKDVLSIDGREQDYLQTQYKNLQNRALIETLVNALRLDMDPRYSGNSDITAAVMSDITVQPIRLSRLVEVKVTHTDRRKAALIANTLASIFIQQNLNLRMGKSVEAIDWLESEAMNLRTNMDRAQAEIQDYKESARTLSLDQSQESVLQELKQKQSDYDKARNDAISATRVATEVERLAKSGIGIESITYLAGDSLIKSLKTSLAEKRSALASLERRYKSKYPLVVNLREDIAAMEATLKSESDKIFASVRNEASIAKLKEQIALDALREQEKKQMELSDLRIEYENLLREAEQDKALYMSVMNRLQETQLLAKQKSNNMRVVDPAKPPVRPIKPKTLLLFALGVFGGFGVALATAFFVDYLDDSIKGQDDIENYLGLSFLGYIPHIETNSIIERDLQAHMHPTSSAAESFRTLRAAVSLANIPEKLRTIVVTSTVPSEGKSLVASNLAIVTAQTGVRTLLLEADLRRPTVHKTFQLHSPQGIASYLQSRVDNVELIVHKTEIPNLDVVCCGAIPSSPSELIGSQRMTQFIDEMKQRYDRIIMDCPPISAVSDPLISAAMSDGLIFVSEFNKIRREHVRKTVMRIQNAGIHILGAVINNIDFEGKDSYYYSHYYYQNGYYSSHYKTDKAELTEGESSKPVKRS